MFTYHEIQKIVDLVSYKPGWDILLFDDGRPYVQVGATTLDSVKKVNSAWRSAKHYLSYHMCRQEIVGMVHHAIVQAELHEVNEFFRYKGAAIFNPHLDPDVLVDVAKRKSSFNLRKNAMSMDE